MRQWAAVQLGDTQALTFVVMATPEDIAANAAFVLHADVVVEVGARVRGSAHGSKPLLPLRNDCIARQVPGGHNFNNYANVNLIVTTAVSQRVDAVWPGASTCECSDGAGAATVRSHGSAASPEVGSASHGGAGAGSLSV